MEKKYSFFTIKKSAQNITFQSRKYSRRWDTLYTMDRKIRKNRKSIFLNFILMKNGKKIIIDCPDVTKTKQKTTFQ